MSDRGTKWKDEATIPAEWIEEARAKRAALKLPAIRLDIEVEKFCNHWVATGKPMKNWKRTWMNWALNAYGAIPETVIAPRIDAEEQRKLERVKLALRGYRTQNFELSDVRAALHAGAITSEEAQKLGLRAN